MFVVEKFKARNGNKGKKIKPFLILSLNILKDNHGYCYLLLPSSLLFLFKYILFLCKWNSC